MYVTCQPINISSQHFNKGVKNIILMIDWDFPYFSGGCLPPIIPWSNFENVMTEKIASITKIHCYKPDINIC